MQPAFSVRAPRSPRDAFQGEALGAGDRGALRRKAESMALDEGARRRGRLVLQPGKDQGRPVQNGLEDGLVPPSLSPLHSASPRILT
jgi:hypothetical protein